METRVGFGTRLGAAIIDCIAILVAGAILGAVLGGVFGVGVGAAAGGGAGEAAAVGGIFGMFLGAALGVHLLSVGWIVWEGVTGAALGKRILKIRIKSDDAAAGTPQKLLLRAAVKYSGSLLGLLAALTGASALHQLSSLAGLAIVVGCFFVLGQNRQGFHDMIAKTAVYPE